MTLICILSIALGHAEVRSLEVCAKAIREIIDSSFMSGLPFDASTSSALRITYILQIKTPHRVILRPAMGRLVGWTGVEVYAGVLVE